MSRNDVMNTIKEGHMAAPGYVITIDRKVFKQTPGERGAAYTVKAKHRKELQVAFGSKWKKHLNVPEKKIGEPIRMSF